MAALHMEDLIEREKKVYLTPAGFSFYCSFLIRLIHFYQSQTAAETKADTT